jgi:hypothetical protein
MKVDSHGCSIESPQSFICVYIAALRIAEYTSKNRVTLDQALNLCWSDTKSHRRKRKSRIICLLDPDPSAVRDTLCDSIDINYMGDRHQSQIDMTETFQFSWENRESFLPMYTKSKDVPDDNEMRIMQPKYDNTQIIIRIRDSDIVGTWSRNAKNG